MRRTVAVVVAAWALLGACSDEPSTDSTPATTSTSTTTTTTSPSTTTAAADEGAEPFSMCGGDVLAEAGHYVVVASSHRDAPAQPALCDSRTGAEQMISPWGRSISCDADGVAVTEFALPEESLGDLLLEWSTSRDGVEVASGTLHLRNDYEAVAALASSSCGDWSSPLMLSIAPVVLSALLTELGFDDIEGDHAIDPTWAAAATHDGQTYAVWIDLDHQGTYEIPGDWSRDCEVGLLAFSPAPSPALLPGLLDAAGCAAS